MVSYSPQHSQLLEYIQSDRIGLNLLKTTLTVVVDEGFDFEKFALLVKDDFSKHFLSKAYFSQLMKALGVEISESWFVKNDVQNGKLSLNLCAGECLGLGIEKAENKKTLCIETQITISVSSVFADLALLEHCLIQWLNYESLSSSIAPEQISNYLNESLEDLEGQVYWNGESGNLDVIGISSLTCAAFDQKIKAVDKKSLILSEEKINNIQCFSVYHGINVESLLCFAWNEALSRLFYGQNIYLGYMVSGREEEELEDILFPLSRTVYLSVNSKKTQDLHFDLQKLQDVLIKNIDFADTYSIEKYSEKPGYFPFGYSYRQNEQSILEVVDANSFTAPGIMNLAVYEDSSGIQCQIEYSSSHLKDEELAYVTALFDAILSLYCQGPELSYSSIENITYGVSQEHLFRRASSVTPFASNTIVDLYYSNYADDNNTIAYRCEQCQLTTLELEVKSNKLAHFLLDVDLPRESVVGVLLSPSTSQIISLLGIMKASLAYLPIDPSTPESRVADMLSTGACDFLITSQDSMLEVENLQCEKLFIDRDWYEIEGYQDTRPQVSILGKQLAYVIFTSGSTGRPKGVGVPHEAIANYLQSIEKRFTLGDAQEFLAFSSSAADLGYTATFAALCYGKTIRSFTKEESLDSSLISRSLASNPVSLLKTIPSFLHALVHSKNTHIYPKSVLIFGGEKLTPDIIDSLKQKGPLPKLFNHYGPTETAVGVLVHCYDIRRTYNEIPIGSVLDNNEVYILDDTLKPLPIGIEGDIYIGGKNLARGYINDPGGTARAFLPNPFKSGERLYKTGERGVANSAGEILFRGRVDEQVKIRGYRVELDEISSLVTQSRLCREHAVIYSKNTGICVAIVENIAGGVVAGNHSCIEKLAAILKERLPDYMFPSVIQRLENIPRLANNKIDKKSLLLAIEGNKSIQTLGPTTPEETVLYDIYLDVFGKNDISIIDNFFHLGGDSIIAIQIVNRAKDAGLSIDLRNIFEKQTIVEIAKTIKIEPAAKSRESSCGSFDLSPVALKFFADNPRDTHHYNHSFIFRINGSYTEAFLSKVFKVIGDHHDVLRSRFIKSETVWKQYITPDSSLFFSCVEFEKGDRSERDAVMAFASERQSEFVLEQGGLFRVWNVKFPQASYLLVVAHHLLVDGVSWRIFFKDISTLVGLASEEPGEIDLLQVLGEKTIAYRHWAIDKYKQLSSLEKSELEFWKKHLSQSRTSEKQSLSTTFGDISSINFSLSPSFDLSLCTRAAKKLNLSVEEILLAIVLFSYREIARSQNIRVLMEGHGREGDFDLSKTMGWFTKLFPLVFSLEQHDLLPTLQDIKAQLTPIKDKLGYGSLRYMHPDGAIREELDCPVDLVFCYLGITDSGIDGLSNLEICDWQVENTRSPNTFMHGPITINIGASERGFEAVCQYNKHLYDEKTINGFLDSTHQVCEKICELVIQANHTFLNLCDFPLLKCNQNQFQQLLSHVDLAVDLDNIQNIYPVAQNQLGMLYHSLAETSSDAYVIQSVMHINEAIDVKAFKYAWDQITQRFDIFRTRFVGIFTECPVQVVNKRVVTPFEFSDSAGIDELDSQAYIEKLCKDELRTKFTSKDPSWMRLKLVKIDVNEYIFIWTLHHAIIDGWSKSVVMSEWKNLYLNALAGESPNQVSRKQYSDYIRIAEQSNIDVARAYWSSYLAIDNIHDAGKIPQDETIAYCGKPKSAECYRLLDPILVDKLARASGNYKVTLNIIFQVTWGLLLCRYNQSEHAVFGSVTSGRNHLSRDDLDIVGPLVNTVPVVFRANRADTFADLLAQAMKNQQQSSAYDYLSLTEISRLANIDVGETLFESLLNFDNYPSLGNSESDIIRLKDYVSLNHYPLTLVFIPNRQIILKYDAKRVSSAFAEKLLDNFLSLLNKTINECNSSVGELLSFGNRIPLQDSSTANTSRPDLKNLVSLYYHNLPADMTELAVSSRAGVLSYQEFESATNKIARLIKEVTTGEQVSIGVYFNASVEQIIAIFSILKAGATFIAIDPQAPFKRNNAAIEAVNCQAILSESRHLDELSEFTAELILLDRDKHDYQELDDSPLEHFISDLSPAYMVFTSGSTGVPKGVVISHRAISNYLAAMEDLTRMPRNAIYSAFASVATDLGYTTLFGALCFGRQLRVFNQEILLSPYELLIELKTSKVDCLKVVPSYLSTIINFGVDVLPKHLLILGGEILTGALVQEIRSLGWQGRILNHYGPTETTVGVLAHEIKKAEYPRIYPVGLPLKSNHVAILDNYGYEVPFGCVGEIAIAGNNLANGYLNQPHATASQFIPDFVGNASHRMYLTGDKGYINSDGQVVCLGRGDGQIKINGYRVELGEIEARIRGLTATDAACVYEKHRGVLAYIATEKPIGLLANSLAEVLPSIMLPCQYIKVKEIPRKSNGKIDKSKLDQITMISPSEKKCIRPETEIEVALVNIIAELASVNPQDISLTDSLHSLDIHSLLAIRLIGKIEQLYSVKIPVKMLYGAANLKTLAQQMESAQNIDTKMTVNDVKASMQCGTLLPTVLQQWYLDTLEERRNDAVSWVNVYELSLSARVEKAHIKLAIETLIAYHDGLRSTFYPLQPPVRDGFLYRTWGANVDNKIPNEMITDLSIREAQYARVLEEISHAYMDISEVKGNLNHWILIEEKDGFKLIILIHHLVHDRPSIYILLRQLYLVLDDLASGREVLLEAKSDSIFDISKKWGELFAEGAGLQKSISFWRNHSWNDIKPIPKKLSKETSINPDEEIIVECDISLEKTECLMNEVATSLNTSLLNIVVWSIARAVAGQFGIQTIFTSVVSDGRDRIEFKNFNLQNTIGWFTEEQKYFLNLASVSNIVEDVKCLSDQLASGKLESTRFDTVRTYLKDLPSREALSVLKINFRGFQSDFIENKYFHLSQDGYLAKIASAHKKQGALNSLLTLNAIIIKGKLSVGLSYSDKDFNKGVVKEILSSFENNINKLLSGAPEVRSQYSGFRQLEEA